VLSVGDFPKFIFRAEFFLSDLKSAGCVSAEKKYSMNATHLPMNTGIPGWLAGGPG